jgi:protoporphyrinogen oxidase
MANHADNVGIEETIYDTVIIGGGIAGLTAAYMLRDKNIRLLEQEDRFGGRIWTEKINEASYNIGTQYLNEEDNAFNHMIDDLGVERITHDITTTAPIAIYLNNQLYLKPSSLLNWRIVLDGIRLLSNTYRKSKIFRLPPDDPRRQKLDKQNLTELQQGYSPEILAIVNAYLKGACVSKPERTSAGIGAVITMDIFNADELAFVKGGTQKITDAITEKLNDKVMKGAGVIKVEEKDGIVSTYFQKDGKAYIVKSKAAVMAVTPQIALELIPQLPNWKKEALAKVDYGPITVISVFLKRNIPWDRWLSMLCTNLTTSVIMDVTFGMEDDKNEDNPIIYNFIISIPPDEKKEIESFLAKADEEIVTLALNDFKHIMPDADIDKYIMDTKVTRFPIGELELSPEYYLELLPQLQKPVGNIHFCGDYTHGESFLAGAAFSGFRAARSLGSRYVASEEKEIPKESKWGAFGWMTMACNILLVACGFFLPKFFGPTLSAGALLLLGLTAAFPFYFPPNKRIYKAFLLVTLGFGGVVGLLAGFIG